MMKKLWIMFLAVVLALAMVIPMAVPAAAAYPDDADPGLVARWMFDEGSGLVAEDISENENDGQLMVNFGRALSFDGIDDYVAVEDPDGLSNLDGFSGLTLEAWIKPDDVSEGWWPAIISKYNSNTGYVSYWLRQYQDEIEVAVYDGGYPFSSGDLGIATTTNADLIAGLWYHVAGTWDGSTFELYVNGVSEPWTFRAGYDDIPATMASNSVDVELGAFQSNSGGNRFGFFKGLIDEVRISDIARTTFDLSSPPSVDGDTVGLWHFDEGYRQIAYDSAASNDGQLGSTAGSDSNDPTWVVSPFKNSGPTWVASQTGYGTALEFDGYTNYVRIPDDSSFDVTGQFTIEAWINGNAFQSTYYDLVVLNKYSDWCFGVFRGSKLIFGETGWQGSFDKQIYSDSLTWNTDTWYHIAVVYDIDTKTADFYRNGSPVGINKQSVLQEGIADPGYITIDYPHMVSLNGIIDEVRIWDSALIADQLDDMTPPEITTNVDNLGVYEAGTILELSADDGNGTGVDSVEAFLGGMIGAPIQDNEPLPVGVYPLTITATDYARNVVTQTLQLIVYDPSAGFVTGGGWVNSPGGSLIDHPEVAGEATFGFVSKYDKRTEDLKGNTQFVFEAGNINLHSTSYEWLVVSGPQAQFFGSGIINGVTECKFLVSVRDSAIEGGGDCDQFRIRIWAPGLIYANQMDLNGVDGDGSIVIHKANK